MLKRETETKNKITLKGILEDIGDNEITVVDEKTGETDVLNILEDLSMFIGKAINLTIGDSVKTEMEVVEEEEEE